MKKGSVSLNSLGTFPSPGAPSYRDSSAVAQKGWSSERVPHPGYSRGSSRRHISASSLTPFYSGRTLPSKWEDAERWICSPVLGYGVSKNAHYQLQRPPKSKSGPIVPPGIAFNTNCSPTSMQVVPDAGGGSVKSLVVGSPFSTGVLMPEGVSVLYGGSGGGGGGNNGGQSCFVQNESHVNVARSSSLPEWSDLVSESSLLSPRDENLEEIKDAETIISHMVSQRDMATQMSSESSSCHSSPKERSSVGPSPPSTLLSVEQNDHPSKLEVREVQVDKRVTMTNWSKRHGSRVMKKDLPDVEDFYHTDGVASASSFDISVAATGLSKLQREEAKISAWENLQRAKAEAAIQKLEVKLEKKRSASMDKILNKLRMAQMKAEDMRSSISVEQEQQISRKAHKVTFFNKLPSVSSLNCFTCPAH
ncbi:hypothetical protein SLA2020_132070 [Shorea laevis]